ncbi:MAG: molybdenum cofactor guanylyltransferase [bacterium]
MDISGVILVGGENSRFEGLPKGALKWDGSTMFERVHSSLNSILDSVYVSVHDEVPPGIPEDLPVIRDRFGSIRGPMNGVYSSLNQIEQPVLVVTWDMPGLNALFLKELLERWQDRAGGTVAMYLEYNDQEYPFPGIFSSEALESFEESLKQEKWGMIQWLEAHQTEAVDPGEYVDEEEAGSLLMNINQPQQIQDMIQRLEGFKRDP